VRFHGGGRGGQPEATAIGSAASARRERHEQDRPHIRIHAGPPVQDLDLERGRDARTRGAALARRVRRDPGDEVDVRAGRRLADGIAEEIDECLLETDTVDVHDNVRRGDVDRRRAQRRNRPQDRDRAVDELVKIDLLEQHGPTSGLRLGEAKEIGREGAQTNGVRMRDPDRTLERGGVIRADHGQLELRPERGDRRPQIV